MKGISIFLILKVFLIGLLLFCLFEYSLKLSFYRTDHVVSGKIADKIIIGIRMNSRAHLIDADGKTIYNTRVNTDFLKLADIGDTLRIYREAGVTSPLKYQLKKANGKVLTDELMDFDGLMI